VLHRAIDQDDGHGRPRLTLRGDSLTACPVCFIAGLGSFQLFAPLDDSTDETVVDRLFGG
jgi:hypothetical protein